MRKAVSIVTLGLAAVTASMLMLAQRPAAPKTKAAFDAKGQLKRPEGYRRWVFLGAPLTPHGLNGGKAGFPEFHHVYVEENNLNAFLKTGSFPEGTVIVKELTRVLNPSFPDGSRNEPSGRGYFK